MGDGPREEPVPKAESPHVHGPLNSSQKARPGLEPVAQASPAPTLRNDKLGHPPPPPTYPGPTREALPPPLSLSMHPFIKRKSSNAPQIPDPVLVTCTSQPASSVANARMGTRLGIQEGFLEEALGSSPCSCSSPLSGSPPGAREAAAAAGAGSGAAAPAAPLLRSGHFPLLPPLGKDCSTPTPRQGAPNPAPPSLATSPAARMEGGHGKPRRQGRQGTDWGPPGRGGVALHGRTTAGPLGKAGLGRCPTRERVWSRCPALSPPSLHFSSGSCQRPPQSRQQPLLLAPVPGARRASVPLNSCHLCPQLLPFSRHGGWGALHGASTETRARPPGPQDNTFSPGTGGRARPLSSQNTAILPLSWTCQSEPILRCQILHLGVGERYQGAKSRGPT